MQAKGDQQDWDQNDLKAKQHDQMGARDNEEDEVAHDDPESPPYPIDTELDQAGDLLRDDAGATLEPWAPLQSPTPQRASHSECGPKFQRGSSSKSRKDSKFARQWPPLPLPSETVSEKKGKRGRSSLKAASQLSCYSVADHELSFSGIKRCRAKPQTPIWLWEPLEYQEELLRRKNKWLAHSQNVPLIPLGTVSQNEVRPKPKHGVPRLKRKGTTWNYHPTDIEVLHITSSSFFLKWKVPHRPSTGKCWFRVQHSIDGKAFETLGTTDQPQYQIYGLSASTRHWAAVTTVILDGAGLPIWEGQGHTHKILKIWTRPDPGRLPRDRYESHDFGVPPEPAGLELTLSRFPRPATAPLREHSQGPKELWAATQNSSFATSKWHSTVHELGSEAGASEMSPGERQSWRACKQSLFALRHVGRRKPREWKDPCLHALVVGKGEPAAKFELPGDQGLPPDRLQNLEGDRALQCSVLQQAYNSTGTHVLPYVTLDEFKPVLSAALTSLGLPLPRDLEKSFIDLDSDGSGQVSVQQLVSHFQDCLQEHVVRLPSSDGSIPRHSNASISPSASSPERTSVSPISGPASEGTSDDRVSSPSTSGPRTPSKYDNPRTIADMSSVNVSPWTGPRQSL